MKLLPTSAILSLGLLASFGFSACEPHPASQTVPNWAEMQAKKENAGEQPEKVSKEAPTFFSKPIQ